MSLNKFLKIAHIEWFFDIFCHFMHNNTMKSSTFTKFGDLQLKYRNFAKFMVPEAPKIATFYPIFRKKFQNFQFFGTFGAEKCVTEQPQSAPLGWSPIQSLFSDMEASMQDLMAWIVGKWYKTVVYRVLYCLLHFLTRFLHEPF